MAQRVFDRLLERGGLGHKEYDAKHERVIMEDIAFSIECLITALRYESETIITDHAEWIAGVLISRTPELSRGQTKQRLVTRYRVLGEVLLPTLSENQAEQASQYLDAAIAVTAARPEQWVQEERLAVGPHAGLRQDYLAALIDGKRSTAEQLILSAYRGGISMPELYIDVLQPVMYEIGYLWQAARLTINQENYCFVATQGVIARLSRETFKVPRRGKLIVACCVGNELHEIGTRMLCDILGLAGWDNLCLGSAIPLQKVLQAIETEQADLLALSVTMPTHLGQCHQVVQAVREKFSTVKIAVGGRAFQLAPDLGRRWPVDICTSDAEQFVQWASQA